MFIIRIHTNAGIQNTHFTVSSDDGDNCVDADEQTRQTTAGIGEIDRL